MRILRFLIFLFFVCLFALFFIGLFQSPEERLWEAQKYLSHCSQAGDWSVGKGGNTNIIQLYNPPQKCLQKLNYVWETTESDLEEGMAVFIGDDDVIEKNRVKFYNSVTYKYR
ncbi:hypothetical protein [Bacillus cereus group sp. BfR-BA-01309]|uniref:hypothetical protein n=1 Tax=Bacillus cereus group sp. BfR-BA-01309 TaxID=2920286 RepID=UPI001F5724CA|nr:hypothetical protein [Bacillus cereus group sp. BfR-BA-01309]